MPSTTLLRLLNRLSSTSISPLSRILEWILSPRSPGTMTSSTPSSLFACLIDLVIAVVSSGIGISIGPPKLELGEWTVQGTRLGGPPAAAGLDPGWISGRNRSCGRDRARPGLPGGTCAPQQPPNPGIWRWWRNGLRRGGGAGRHPAPRRRALAPVHRRGAPQVGENLVDHSGLGNERDDAHLVSAAGTFQRLDLENAAQQLRPAAAGFPRGGTLLSD